jgi:hypothetical protein
MKKSQRIRRCKVCRCTDDRACLTEAGPCSWVSARVCSGCTLGREDRLKLLLETVHAAKWLASAIFDCR